MKAGEVLGRVLLVTGKEEFLGSRTVDEVKAAVRAFDADAEAKPETLPLTRVTAVRAALLRGLLAGGGFRLLTAASC